VRVGVEVLRPLRRVDDVYALSRELGIVLTRAGHRIVDVSPSVPANVLLVDDIDGLRAVGAMTEERGIFDVPLAVIAADGQGSDGWTLIFGPDDDDPDRLRVYSGDRAIAVVVHWVNGVNGLPSDVDLHELRLSIEAFLYEWRRLASDLRLSADDRRTGDALAEMASDVIKSENPPTKILAATFEWFLHKVNVFSEEAASAAGKAFGASAGAGAGLAVTGQLPKLVAAVGRVLSHLPS
jgi:hypothetical protein